MVSTEVQVTAEHTLQVELMRVSDLIDDVVAEGGFGSVVLRTFDMGSVAFRTPTGYPIPFKTVRGWFLNQSGLHPLGEAAMFDAFCTDNATGDPIPPERGVLFADAWPVAL